MTRSYKRGYRAARNYLRQHREIVWSFDAFGRDEFDRGWDDGIHAEAARLGLEAA